MKNLNQMYCTELNLLETQKITGGCSNKPNFWQDLAYLAGTAIDGIISFGKKLM